MDDLKELNEYLMRYGSDVVSIDKFVQLKLKRNSIWWLKLWIITIMLLLGLFCSKDYTCKKVIYKDRSFYKTQVDSLQNFVDTTYDIPLRVINRSKK